jgi:K+ transport systems, NAD-binding component
MTLPTEARPRSPQSPSYDTPSRLQGVLWASPFLLLVYGLGLWGYWQYRPPGSVPGEDGWDLAYYALQLFVLEFTATDGTPVPLVLKIARVVAPVILTGAVVTIIEIVRTTLLVRRLTRRGFALVVGDTAEARAVAEAKRRLSDKAVYEFATGDLVSPQALRAVGIRRADAVYALGDDREDVAANVATALAAVSARRARRTRILVHVTDPELVIGLRARRFMTEAGQLVEFFTMDEAAARAHVAQESFPAGEPPRILVAGAGAFGQAVVVEVARRWRDTPGRGEGRVEVVLVDASASAVAARLRERWVVVDRHCHLTPIDTTDPTAVLRDQPVIGRPHRAYICYEDEQVALRTALAAVPLWHGGPGSLVVRLSQLARHAEAFRTGGLLDDLEGRLVVANVADLGAPEVVRDRDIFWQLAEVVHERYLRNELAKGRQLGSTLALRPWAELRDDFRDNNYEQACHLAVKLRRIGATVAPRSDRNPPFALTDEEIEVLARLEHERWMANRRKHRWRYGPQRDDTRRIHPDLVPWEDLSEQSRQRDRDAVAAIPAEFGEVLAEFGLQIVRLAPTPASVPAQAVAPAG